MSHQTRQCRLPGDIALDPCVFTQGLNMLNVKDRRIHDRQRMNETILFRLATPGTSREFLSGRLKNISPGGILFETDVNLAVGDTVYICFKTENAFADTCARAEIVRVTNLGARLEVGAKFT